MDSAEKAQRRRSVLLLFVLAMFILAQLIALGASQRIVAGTVRVVDILQLLSPIVLALGIARGLFGIPRFLRDAHAKRAVNDELYLENRRRACEAGLCLATVVVLVIALTSPFFVFNDYEVAHAVMFAIVGTTVVRFVWLERTNSNNGTVNAGE